MGVSVIISIALAIVLAAAIVKMGLASPNYTNNLPLANVFLANIPLPGSDYFSASPEVITSVLWDQRGIDTYYETSVLFLAIIGTLYLFAGRLKPAVPTEGMTVIVKLIAKLVAPIIMVVALSVALHGHLTPGGGFQGGAIFVVAPLLVIAALGGVKLTGLGFEKDTLLSLRITGLIIIALVGIATVIIGVVKGVSGYIFLNQPKPSVPIGYVASVSAPWGTILISGTLMVLNIMEFMAVSAGFTLALLALDSVVEGEMK